MIKTTGSANQHKEVTIQYYEHNTSNHNSSTKTTESIKQHDLPTRYFAYTPLLYHHTHFPLSTNQTLPRDYTTTHEHARFSPLTNRTPSSKSSGNDSTTYQTLTAPETFPPGSAIR